MVDQWYNTIQLNSGTLSTAQSLLTPRFQESSRPLKLSYAHVSRSDKFLFAIFSQRAKRWNIIKSRISEVLLLPSIRLSRDTIGWRKPTPNKNLHIVPRFSQCSERGWVVDCTIMYLFCYLFFTVWRCDSFSEHSGLAQAHSHSAQKHKNTTGNPHTIFRNWLATPATEPPYVKLVCNSGLRSRPTPPSNVNVLAL